MILEDSQERWLIADIGNVLIVQVIQPSHEIFWASECAYQPCLVMRDEERIFPNAALKGLRGVVL